MPGPVHGLAWSADGALIAGACATGEVRLYKAELRKKIATLKGHEGPTFAVAFSPDSQQVATAGFDGKVRVSETKKGEPIREFEAVPLSAPAAATALRSAK